METIEISRYAVETAHSINDLKENIRALKEAMGDLGIGTKEYADALVSLQTNQAALKNAMHDTTYEADGGADAFAATAKAAQGLGTSYNALVRQMADLDQQFRREEDVAKRDELGKKIKNLNDQLKELDAQRGKYQRNVGNYKSAMEGLGQAFVAVGGSAGQLIVPLNNLNKALDVLKAHPVVGMLGLLAAALGKVVEAMKTSEENFNRWNMAAAAFKPIGDAMTRTLQAVGEAVSKLALRFSDLLMKWGLLDEQAAKNRQRLEQYSQNTLEIERRLRTENARLEADVAEAREIASNREMYSAKKRLEALEKAQWSERQIAKNNELLAQRRLEQLKEEAKLSDNSIATNNAIIDAEVELINVRTRAAEAQRTLLRQITAVQREMGKSTKETTDEVVREAETIEALPNAMFAAAEQMETAQSYMDRVTEEHINKRMEMNREEKEDNERQNAERIKAAFGYASAVSSIFGSLADIYEENGEQDERSAQRAKAMRTASAIIDTISGAVSAYMNTVKSIEFTPVAIPLAVANAATVLAAGMAQIKQINAVKVGSGGGTASVSAPAFSPAMAQTRTITGATEEERLNRMASENRVYLVYSDIEAANYRQRVRVQETEF